MRFRGSHYKSAWITSTVGCRGIDADYSLPPLRFDTYSAADQQRVRERMAQIEAAQAREAPIST